MKLKSIYFLILFEFLANINICYGQATSSDPFQFSPAPNMPFATTDFLGWATGSVISDLTIKTEDPNIPINFYTNSLTNSNPAMTIDGNNGNAGIGNTSPPYKLTVTNDALGTDIDVQCFSNPASLPPQEGYRFNDLLILSAAGTDNLFCGHHAGEVSPSGYENTFVGSYAGSQTQGNTNTCIGVKAGFLNVNGYENVFTGAFTGYSNGSGYNNAFIGVYAGNFNNDGSKNTFLGAYAGASNYDASENTFLGFESGTTNASGTSNSFTGAFSGKANAAGNENTFNGFKAGFTNNDGNHNTFVGAYAGLSNYDASRNTFNGTYCGYSNTSGADNTFSGYYAGHDNLIGNRNTFVGVQAGWKNNTKDNTFIGFSSGLNTNGSANANGYHNVFVGGYSGYYNASGISNTYIGFEAGYACNGNYNTMVGRYAGYSNSSGSSNSFFGKDAGYQNTGSSNVYVGHHSGFNSGSSNANTFVGTNSGQTDAGSFNCFIGYEAGKNMSSGDKNTFIGNAAQASTTYTNLTNSSAIGNGAVVTADDQMILGNVSVNVGIGLSGNPTGPQDKLEISSGTTGVSGLQFRDLNSSYSPSSTATKFLTVDVNGKVILKDSPGGGSVVSACGSLTTSDVNFVSLWSTISVGGVRELCKSQLYDNLTYVGIGYTGGLPSSPQKLSLNGNLRLDSYSNGFYLGTDKFLFSNSGGTNVYLGVTAGPTGTSSGLGTICIGPGSGNSLSNSEDHNILIGNDAGSNLSGTSTDAIGNVCLGYLAGEALTTGSTNVCIGAQAGSGTALSTFDGNVILGVLAGNAGAGDDNVLIGNNAEVTPGSTISNSCAIGLNATVEASNSIAIGANSRCVSPNSISLGDCSTSNVRTLIGYTTNPAPSGSNGFRLYVSPVSHSQAAYFAGDLVSTTGNYLTSDSNLKTNIQPLSEIFTRGVLSQLSPKSYNYNVAGNPSLNLENGNHYGLIAQDVEAILPELVKEVTAPPITDSIGNIIIAEKTFKTLNYTGLIPFIVQSLKSQQHLIDSLETKDSINNARMDHLEQLINSCCTSSSIERTKNSIDVELGSENTIILNQNDPNPFAEQTRITYTVPSEVHEAKIIFFDNTGHVMQTVKINERGAGQINVYGEKLSSGIYSYSLIADGKVIDTKKMVCNK